MPEQELQERPYLRGLLTITAILLVYVYGEASIDSEVSALLFGLRISNQWPIELLLVIMQLTFMWRFWVKNQPDQASEQRELRQSAQRVLRASNWLTRSVYQSFAKVPKVEDQVQGRNVSIDVLSVRSFIIWEVKLSAGADRFEEISVLAFGWKTHLVWKLASLANWAWYNDAFANRILPKFVSVFALVSALVSYF